MRIRPYHDSDCPAVWRIFQEVVAAGDTYTYDPGWSADEARAVWVEAPPGQTVVACAGPRVLGTAKLGPNRPGPTGFRDLPIGIDGLYLGGAGCHGGPGITFIPGYNAGYQALEDIGASSART